MTAAAPALPTARSARTRSRQRRCGREARAGPWAIAGAKWLEAYIGQRRGTRSPPLPLVGRPVNNRLGREHDPEKWVPVPACAKPPTLFVVRLDASAGEARSERIM